MIAYGSNFMLTAVGNLRSGARKTITKDSLRHPSSIQPPLSGYTTASGQSQHITWMGHYLLALTRRSVGSFAVNHVVARISVGDVVDTGTAIDGFVRYPVARVDEDVAFTADYGVETGLAEDRVVALLTPQEVVTIPAFQPVVVRGASCLVVALLAIQPIHTGATDQFVVARAATYLASAATCACVVVTRAAEQAIGLRAAVQVVVTGASQHEIYTGTPEQCPVVGEPPSILSRPPPP